MKYCTLCFLIITSSFCTIHSQIISGKILDKNTRIPVEYATAYINNTTTGSMCDSMGNFTIMPRTYPCELVVSKMGYEPNMILLEKIPGKELVIKLTPQPFKIDAAEVEGTNIRERNMRVFLKEFIGEDKFGANASILNPQDLIFKLRHDTFVIANPKPNQIQRLEYQKKNYWWSQQKDTVFYSSRTGIEATSPNPIIIEQPLLGYTIHLDLIEFKAGYNSTYTTVGSQYRFFSFFSENIPPYKRDTIRIYKHRNEAYFNSAQHFLQALYDSALTENGYKISTTQNSYYLINEKKEPFEISKYVNTLDSLKYIAGLKDKQFKVEYFSNLKGEPVNYTKRDHKLPIESEMHLISDSCIITQNGTQPQPHILFSSITGSIGAKKVGALLPTDYKQLNIEYEFSSDDELLRKRKRRKRSRM